MFSLTQTRPLHHSEESVCIATAFSTNCVNVAVRFLQSSEKLLLFFFPLPICCPLANPLDLSVKHGRPYQPGSEEKKALKQLEGERSPLNSRKYPMVKTTQ